MKRAQPPISKGQKQLEEIFRSSGKSILFQKFSKISNDGLCRAIDFCKSSSPYGQTLSICSDHVQTDEYKNNFLLESYFTESLKEREIRKTDFFIVLKVFSEYFA